MREHSDSQRLEEIFRPQSLSNQMFFSLSFCKLKKVGAEKKKSVREHFFFLICLKLDLYPAAVSLVTFSTGSFQPMCWSSTPMLAPLAAGLNETLVTISIVPVSSRRKVLCSVRLRSRGDESLTAED